MFVDINETINFTIYYKKQNNFYVVCNQENFGKITEEKEKSLYKSVSLKTKPFTWGISNELNESAIVRNDNGDRVWNYKLFKEHKLKTILVSWDAKRVNRDGESEVVPLTNDSLLSLAPEIAEAILSTYDELTTK
jgi:hypothetical protein